MTPAGQPASPIFRPGGLKKVLCKLLILKTL